MTIAQPEQAAEFAAFLVNHLGGRAHEEVSAELHQLIAAVTEHGKKGSLSIVVTVAPPQGHIDGGPLAIAIDSTLKAPKASAPPSIYFVDADGNATRNDPRQIAIDFRTVPATTEFRSV
ncbi:hypothetical protein [Kitasatospora sp. McL0602]|uniref:hypothetical protein n=1 Tax=Kitasatospora sp. McL0602 TaxID=3439530 RepID=UPI003F88D759